MSLPTPAGFGLLEVQPGLPHAAETLEMAASGPWPKTTPPVSLPLEEKGERRPMARGTGPQAAVGPDSSVALGSRDQGEQRGRESGSKRLVR